MKQTFRLFFGLTASLFFCLTIFAQDVSRETLRDQIQAKRAELATLEKQFLEPTAADRAQFATLVAEPNTGADDSIILAFKMLKDFSAPKSAKR